MRIARQRVVIAVAAVTAVAGVAVAVAVTDRGLVAGQARSGPGGSTGASLANTTTSMVSASGSSVPPTGSSAASPTGRSVDLTPTPPPVPADDDGLAWLPWGPSDSVDPPPDQWYTMIERGQCMNGSDGTVWGALAALCAVAIDGDTSQWEKALQVPPVGTTPVRCLEAATRALLERAAAWHQRNPGSRPVVRLAQPGEAPACQYKLGRVILHRTNSCSDLTTVPLSGPTSGGTELGICGSGIGTADVTVMIGDQAATGVQVESPTYLRVKTPPAAGSNDDGTIRVSTPRGELLSGRRFRYITEPAVTEPTTTTTTTTTR